MSVVIGVEALVGKTYNANWSNLFKASQNEGEANTYVINWAGELDDDSISTSDWATEDSLTVANEQNTTTQASCRLSATDPGRYRVVNTITTANGNTLQRIIELRVGANYPENLLADYV